MVLRYVHPVVQQHSVYLFIFLQHTIKIAGNLKFNNIRVIKFGDLIGGLSLGVWYTILVSSYMHTCIHMEQKILADFKLVITERTMHCQNAKLSSSQIFSMWITSYQLGYKIYWKLKDTILADADCFSHSHIYWHFDLTQPVVRGAYTLLYGGS